MKLEFLMCGNMTDAFLSQAAIFRMKLDSLGGDYGKARLVMCVGAPERVSLPRRWVPWFERIELCFADTEHYARVGDHAQGHRLYEVLDPSADLAVICDADSLLLRPLPEDFLNAMRTSPAVCGCLAHFPPPLIDGAGQCLPEPASHSEMWGAMSDRVLGRPIRMSERYTLQRDPDPCPFYINHAFLAGTPALLAELYEHFRAVLPQVRAVLDNDFYDQLGVAFAVERGGLPYRALPLRFNFPNDPLAEELHPDEADNIVHFHYLRTDKFDRHKIFADPAAFANFMQIPFEGSNAVFRDEIRALTGGTYPFAS
jgi:hypothetical protein